MENLVHLKRIFCLYAIIGFQDGEAADIDNKIVTRYGAVKIWNRVHLRINDTSIIIIEITRESLINVDPITRKSDL